MRRGESISKRREGHIPSQARPEAASAALNPNTSSPNATRETVHRKGGEVRSSTPGQETGESDDGGGKGWDETPTKLEPL